MIKTLKLNINYHAGNKITIKTFLTDDPFIANVFGSHKIHPITQIHRLSSKIHFFTNEKYNTSWSIGWAKI